MAVAELDCSPLQDGFAGELILPGKPPYDEARTIFNAMIDRRPAVIAQSHEHRDGRRGRPDRNRGRWRHHEPPRPGHRALRLGDDRGPRVDDGCRRSEFDP